MKSVALVVAVAVLGASCTGDRPPSSGQESSATPAKPICDRMPAGVPVGFMLVRTRELPNSEYVAVRREYRDAEDRFLVYLLGVAGEVGEGTPVADQVDLRSGMDATLLGGPEGNWVLTWQDEFPCSQMSVVGNSFTRTEFEATMREAGLLAGG